QELSDKFAKASIAVVSDYRGLTVTEFEELRIALKKCDSEVKVAKNTLLRKASQSTPFESLNDHFKGTTALSLAYGDPVAPAKVLIDFAKTHSKLAIRSAVLEGKVLTFEDLSALSTLPSKEVLLGQLLSVMQAVPTGFVRVLNAIPQKFVYVLQAVKDQKEQ
ncbi:MAG: 50S ribosomal protein L10, partial [Proteobacteria bacterium]|nr:50S ribosomal protein L10 [Desulfobulbaceae bacterium]MBU4153063.1 50S ribosomal protein L10 [Pseudomonadota bacterium]